MWKCGRSKQMWLCFYTRWVDDVRGVNNGGVKNLILVET